MLCSQKWNYDIATFSDSNVAVTSHCYVTLFGDSNILGTPHFTCCCHLTMSRSKYHLHDLPYSC